MYHLRLQNIVFPKGERFVREWRLFCQGERPVYDFSNESLILGADRIFEFSTYLNSFYNRKWKKYTDLKKVVLHLNISGSFKLYLTGFSLDVYNPIRKVLSIEEFNLENATEIVLEYPDSEDTILAFEIETSKECRLYSGYFEGIYDPSCERDVQLSLVTTTFKKEAFILSNINLIKKEIIDKELLMKDSFQVHVIDNGRTLSPEEYNSPYITIHPNKNVGGSGGFAYGMLHAVKDKTNISHVLLMDDDVLLLPESIKRTFALLKVLKTEYDNHFISGAMLCYEQMNIQHEDIGFVHTDGSYGPLKRRWDHNDLRDVLLCDQEPVERKHMYAGWWYCCIPVSLIKKNGLPLPLFVRGDDVEFSLRNKAKFITMNGICIWHMGFTYKFNAAMELYQVHRNSLILQATTKCCKKIDFIKRMKKLFRARLLSLDYNGAELILDAINDFMRGPDFIAQDNGEKIMQEKCKKNEILKPISELKDTNLNIDGVYFDIPRGFLKKWIYRVTYNGHRFLPQCFLRKWPDIVAYDWFYAPGRNFLHKQLLAINPHMKTASIRTFNKKRYKELKKKYYFAIYNYKKNHEKIEKSYSEKASYLTSSSFWENYLNM